MTAEAQLKRSQMGTLSAAALETILVIFWQRIWLLYGLRICLRLNGQRRCQDSPILTTTLVLVITLMQVSNGKGQLGKKGYKMRATMATLGRQRQVEL